MLYLGYEMPKIVCGNRSLKLKSTFMKTSTLYNTAIKLVYQHVQISMFRPQIDYVAINGSPSLATSRYGIRGRFT